MNQIPLKGLASRFPVFFFMAVLIGGCIETDIENALAENLRIIEPEEVFRVSGQYELMAEYTDDSGEPVEVPIVWESSDPQILQINGSTATCLAEGAVFINAEAEGNTASLLVEVQASRESIEISNFVEVLQVGNSFTFQVNYTDADGNSQVIGPDWGSADESVATVNNQGQVTAVSEGTTTITASFGNVSHQVMLQTTNDPVLVDPEIRITIFNLFMDEGESFTFVAEYFGEDGQPDPTEVISWESSNTLVLTIDNDGNAMALTPGTTTVTASAGTVTASVTVTVEEVVTERTGSLMGTGYTIAGSFRLSVNSDGDIILNVENYVSAGPGPYFYLTNSDNNVANGLRLGEAKANGSYEINVSDIDDSVQLYTYQYLMVWCEPVSVRLGFGQFDN